MGGTAPEARRPSQRWRPPPPGTARHHPRGTQPPQGMQAKGTVLGPHTHTPAPTARGGRTPTARPVGRQSGEGQRLTSDAPHNGGRHPLGDVLPPPPQRATPARKGARCGAGAGSPRPHRPHPGHTGRGTLAARSRGRAAGGGTAPDTRHPSTRWQATPPRDSPPPSPRHAAPTGHAGQGDSVGPPHQHGHAHGTWVADPNSLPSGRAVRGGTAPDLRRPSQWWKAAPPDTPHNGSRPPPPGTAPHHPGGTQPPQGMQAKGTVLGPHNHTPAPTARGWRTPTARTVGRQSGEGQCLTSDAPHNGGRHPPRGRPSTTLTASNTGPQGRTLWGWCWVPTPAPTAPETHGTRNPGCLLHRTGGRGRDRAPYQTPLTTVAGHPPPGTAPHHPRGTQPPQGMQAKGTVFGPHTHTPTPTALWLADPNSPPSGRAVWGGGAPDLRRPSQWWKASPPGKPFRNHHSEERRPDRAHAVGPVLGPHARTDCTRDTRVAEPRLTAPEDERPGEGQRLTPDAPHNGGRPPPPGDGPPPLPRHAAPTGHAGPKKSRLLRYGSQSEEHRNMERFQLITQVFYG